MWYSCDEMDEFKDDVRDMIFEECEDKYPYSGWEPMVKDCKNGAMAFVEEKKRECGPGPGPDCEGLGRTCAEGVANKFCGIAETRQRSSPVKVYKPSCNFPRKCRAEAKVECKREVWNMVKKMKYSGDCGKVKLTSRTRHLLVKKCEEEVDFMADMCN